MSITQSISRDDYFAQPLMNSSTLKPFLKSAKHGFYMMENKKEPSSSMSLGTAVHSLVLEGEKAFQELLDDYYCVIRRDAENAPINPKTDTFYGTSSGKFKAWVAEYANGREVITEEAINETIKMARAAAAHGPTNNILFQCPERETMFTWVDEDTGIECKALTDFYGPKLGGDLKTCARMDTKDQIEKQIINFGYHFQFAFYLDGMRANGLDIQEFIAIFVSSSNEYDVGCFIMSDEAIKLGRKEYKKALVTYHNNLETNTLNSEDLEGAFPDIQKLSVPYWALNQNK